MKSASTALKTHLQKGCTTLARLYKLTRKDGQVFTFTDHDKDLSTVGLEGTFTDDNPSTGGYVYEAAVGGMSPTAIENHSDLSADNQELTSIIDSVVIKEEELRYGIWDAADVEIRLVNWADLTQGELKLRKGKLGNMTLKNGMLTAEVLGLTNPLQQIQGRSFGPTCDAELGDSRCQAVVPVFTGSANANPSVGISDSHHVTPYSGLTTTEDYFSDGIMTFTSGGNSGLSFQIKYWNGATLYLQGALFVPIVDGDTFTISPGCDHTIPTCHSKYGNEINFQGFPKMPGQDEIMKYPDATS